MPRESLLRLVTDLWRRPWREVGAEHYYDDYRRLERLAPEVLRQRQLAALRRLVWHAWLHVPAQKLRIAAVLAPTEVEKLDDPGRLPLQPLAPLELAGLASLTEPDGRSWRRLVAGRRRSTRPSNPAGKRSAGARSSGQAGAPCAP